MKGPDCLANVQLIKLMIKTVGPFKIIFAALDTITANENGICSTISGDRAALDPSCAQIKDETDQTNDFSATKTAKTHETPDGNTNRTLG